MNDYIEKKDNYNMIKQQVNILLVDDRPENLLALKTVLKNPDYHLVCADSGEEALKCILKQDFAVILIDVQMPGLNGFDTVKLIKKRKKTKHIPIIFITAINQTPKHVITGYSIGAVDYIFKPFDPNVLKMKVEAFVEIHCNREQIKLQRELLKNHTLELQQAYKQMEKERKQQYEKLENLVKERTKELLSANEQLEKSQERFKKYFRASPSLLSIRSLTDGRYIDVNKSWLKNSGYEYDEVINQTNDLLGISYEKIKNKECLLKLKEIISNEKMTYFTKSGEKRKGLLSTEIIEISGEKCVLTVIVDITEQLYFEEELARLDRLNLVGEMAAGIAHEIRNPMTTIKGFLQMAKNEISFKYIDIMLEELDRANNIITEYLTLAKNKQSNQSLQGLNEIIQSIYPLFDAEAKLAAKEIQLQLSECPLLYLDEKEIRQLILNLVLNGLDAMSAGGNLTIKTYVENDEVVLFVQDEGRGIKEEVFEKIWNPFFTTKEKGTGLGLAICYSVASRHQAVIDVDTSDKGTTFYVRFKQNFSNESEAFTRNLNISENLLVYNDNTL